MTTQCPCGKGKLFTQCCGPFLAGLEYARTAEQLMRSRFTAYRLGGYGEYLLKTWHPATAGDLSADDLSEVTNDWCALDILFKSQDGDNATVEFKAWYKTDKHDAIAERGGEYVNCLHERSAFTRVNGRWLYVGGEIH